MRCPLCEGAGHYKFELSAEGKIVFRNVLNPARSAKWMMSPGACGLCEGAGYIWKPGDRPLLADPLAARAIHGSIIPGTDCSPESPGAIADAMSVFKALAAFLDMAFERSRAGLCPKCGAILQSLVGGVQCSKCGFQKYTRNIEGGQ
jgi:hypothetical protein